MKCTTDDSRMAHASKKRGAKDAAGAAAKCFGRDSEWCESLLINHGRASKVYCHLLVFTVSRRFE